MNKAITIIVNNITVKITKLSLLNFDLIFSILVVIYYSFTKDSYDDMQELGPCDSLRKKNLTKASFLGSFLVLLSGLIFLGIAILDENIDVEIAFN